MAKTGCILVEKVGQVVPLELMQKIREHNQTCAGVAMSVDGSQMLALQPFRVLPTAEEWCEQRGMINESLCVSWWANADAKESYQDAEVQPATMLSFEGGEPALVAFTVGEFSNMEKPKTNLGAIFHFHEELRGMIEDLNVQNDGDIDKILEACNGSLFQKWWRSCSTTHAFTLLLTGQLKYFIFQHGMDKGFKGDWGEVTDAYGWNVKTVGADPATPAGKLAAMAARLKGGPSAVVTATTSAEKLAQAATKAVTPKPTVPGPKPAVTSPSPSQPQGEPGKGEIFPPDDLIVAWKAAKFNQGPEQQDIYEWYLKHNSGRAPSGWKAAIEKGDPIGVKEGQAKWIRPATPATPGSKTQQKAALKSMGANATPPGAIARPTATQTAALEAIANDPAYSDERKLAMVEKFMTDDAFIDAISYDNTKVMTIEDLNKLDRPKASPATVFADAGITDYDGMRWGPAEWKKIAAIDLDYIVDIIMDLRYKYLSLKLGHPAVVSPDTVDVGGKKLIGPAAAMAAMIARVKKAG
jgi:hypothetical protein